MTQRRVQSAIFRKRIRALLLPIGLSCATLVCLAQIAPAPGPDPFGGGPGAFPGAGPSDPGVQSDNRGTGASLVTPANDPGGYVAFFQDAQTRFAAEDNVT